MEQDHPLSTIATNLFEFLDSEANHEDELEVQNLCEEQFTSEESRMPKNIEVQSKISMVEEFESRLAVGKILESPEAAYLLYCKYAHAKGFGVRKGDNCYFTCSSEIRAKDFECSCQGVKDEKRSSERIPIYQKPITRTKCKARLTIARERDGEWKIITQHFACSKSTLEAMYNAGIPIANAFSYMGKEAQGPQNLGFVRKDAYDHFNRIRRNTKVEDGDAFELLQYFINKLNTEYFFFWNVQLNDDNRIMNFFFRDYRCKVDYECFGDVVSVDTTYRTNKYNLICAPFVGIHHHKQNVMFGLAFMSDETESSFEWLFTTFLKSMYGKEPETVFTDQCQAMMNVVETVFPCAHHRLCQWHINQNAPSYFGSLNGDTRFKQLWHQCMTYCESEEEFESV
ncbi:hypothetical protein BUALT_Bualt02G0058900 [Buddleja alternifolia]|uniref:Protein FAR1-RELATED SEQUENCE n=1 Tax=Buddleja alternifolia TaxID=168488 RepID=A0AAV6XXR8_9LAMI|nr:hypothetical protein BUALT_Bualt02G0058900 [Buddleja alternifolia]